MKSFKLTSLIKETYFLFLLLEGRTSSYVQSSIVFSAIGAESLGITRASNNPDSFFTAIKPLISLIYWQWVSNGKIKSVILKFFKQASMRF